MHQARNSSKYWWKSIAPWSCFFKLCSQAEKGCLITEATGKLRPHQKIDFVPIEGYRHGRLPCGIKGGRQAGQNTSAFGTGLEPFQGLVLWFNSTQIQVLSDPDSTRSQRLRTQPFDPVDQLLLKIDHRHFDQCGTIKRQGFLKNGFELREIVNTPSISTK